MSGPSRRDLAQDSYWYTVVMSLGPPMTFGAFWVSLEVVGSIGGTS